MSMSYSIEVTPSQKRDRLTLKTMKQGKTTRISGFIRSIGEKIEKVSGAKLNFSKATVPDEEWIPKEQEKMLLKGVQLRTEKQTQTLEVVKLKKFDPCSLNGNSEISCRASGCQQTTPRLRGQSKEYRTKQDLFLCGTHCKELTETISMYYADEGVPITNVENSNSFEGYTSLIGVLEKAFMHLKSKWFRTTSDALLAEVFLNTRNFLIITNALLNPSEYNVTTALGPYLSTFQMILDDPMMLQNAITLLLLASLLVYKFYGIIYRWVHVPLENPGAKIGVGVGLIIVFMVFLVFDDVPFWLAHGLWYFLIPFGLSLIMSGAWDWSASRDLIEQRRVQSIQMHNRILSAIGSQTSQFVVSGDAAGNVSVAVPEF